MPLHLKRLIVTISLLLPFSGSQDAFSQCNEWERLLAYDQVYVADLERDRFGNMYVVGWFNSPNFTIDGTHIPLYGNFSIFILKFGKNFSLQWAKSIGNNSLDLAVAIEIDREDNPVIAGYFYSSSITFDCITLYNSSRSELFLVKYTPQGIVQWAKSTTGLEDGFAADIAVSETNNIILTSTFVTGNVTFGGKSVQGTGGYDSFVTTITPSGNVLWMRSFGGSSGVMPDYIFGVDTDINENIIITGFFESDIMVFDNFTLPRLSVSENFFATKLSKDGNTLWAKGSQGPADNGGYDIKTDQAGNIYIVGRFYGGDTKFGNISLSDQGEGDLFIVKYDNAGNALQAKNFGGSRFDTAQELDLDPFGNIVVSGFFYSYDISFDSFPLHKPEFQADAFVITLDNAFTTQCVKQVSGPSEALLSALTVDKANNIWIAVDNLLGEDVVDFDDIFSSTKQSMIAVIGAENSFDPDTSAPDSFDIRLGEDITKCIDEVIHLDAGQYCNATYTWSDGSHDHFLITSHPGVFWVTVTRNGQVARDTIVIQIKSDFEVDLGTDRSICEGANIIFDVTQAITATYEWDDGSILPTRSIQTPGTYWVSVRNECAMQMDSILITMTPPLSIDLGMDTVVCGIRPFQLGKEIPGAQSYHWQDGSTSPTLVINASGTYRQTASNECESKQDEINVTFLDVGNFFIPNVVTADGDYKNDTFILPQVFQEGTSLTIFNRWGKPIYNTDNYQNNWPANDELSGDYYYSLKGSCFQHEFKGHIHVFR